MKILSSEQMKEVELYASRLGLSYQRMMENAGTACARNIRNEIEKDSFERKKIAVVCGRGNNGGDGFVIARKLSENGHNVCVILAAGYPSSQEATYMYKLLLDQAVPNLWYDADKIKCLQTIKTADVVVDCVFGFSFHGTLSDEMAELLNEMSLSSAVKFAIDLPSGVHCDSGFCSVGCFTADFTIAVSALKPAHVLEPSCERCGDIIIANIGIPEESYRVVKDSLYTYSKAEVRALLPMRDPKGHKGTFGHVLCICGSKTMAGAPVLCASAALRSGAGLVTLAFPEVLYGTVSSKLTEALLMPLPENEKGTLSADCLKELIGKLDKFDSIVIGCGLGVNEDTTEILRAVLQNSKVPVVIDADGLTILSKDISILENVQCKVVLTPHAGEFARLTGLETDKVMQNRVSYASALSSQSGTYVALKGANTVVSSPESKSVYVNSTGNTGLSKGGSGDVLAGLIGGLIAQSMEVGDALTAAVYIHGCTGDAVSERTSKRGMLPMDVVNELAYVMAEFE